MRNQRVIRLQSTNWWNLRKSTKLSLLGIFKNVNYKVFIKSPDDTVYSHYLNPEEVEKLLNSDWIKTHEIYPMEYLYDKHHLIKLICKGVSCYE